MMECLLIALVRIFCGTRARWMGEMISAKQRIYFANHTSNLDALVLWASLPGELRKLARPIAARDYWNKGPLRRYLAEKILRAVLIERRKVTVSDNPLEAMLKALDEGCSLIIFPEGGRFPGPEPGPFKSGLYHLAKQRPAAELMPVYLENLNRILPKGETLPVPMLASLTVGTPLTIRENETKVEFLERARLAVWNLRLT